MNTIKKIHSSDLKAGMILAKDISINDIKLLTQGIEITQVIATRLQKQIPLSYIYIYDEYDPKNKDLFEERNSTKMKKSQESFLAFTNAAENLFSKTMESNTITMNSVRDICDNILSQLTDVGIVIKNILEGQAMDDYLFRHSVNVSALCALMGKWLKLSEKDILLLTYSGMLHDIGKCHIPAKILTKPGSLTKSEKDICNKHTNYSYELVKKIPFLDPSVAIATLLHHEREDGSGYPIGLKGEQIPLFAKIIAIADMFDAMTSNKVYKEKQCALYALEEIKNEIFSKLDPSLGSTFINNILTYHIGEIVELNNGKLGKIIKIDANNISKPWVEIDGNFVDLSAQKELKITDILQNINLL